MTGNEWVMIIAAIGTVLIPLATLVVSAYTARKTSSTHTLVNGMSGRLSTANRAQGQAEGRLAESKGTDTPLA